MSQETFVIPAEWARSGSQSADAPVDLLLRFARVAHSAGYPTADLEERVRALAGSFELAAQVSATPTLVEISLGSLSQQSTYTLRVAPAAVDLAAIARIDDLIRDVLGRRVEIPAARAALDELAAGPQDRPWPVVLGAYALVAAALTPILGGGWREAAAAALVGLIVGAIALPLKRTPRTEPVIAPLAAIAASFCAGAFVWMGLESSPEVITLAGLLALLPGMALTIGMRELATQHLQSGVANTANALVQLLGLVVGVGIGHSLARSAFGVTQSAAPQIAFGGTHLLAALAAGAAFTVTLRAETRDVATMCGATVLALAVNDAARRLVGVEAGVFASALTVGVVGGVLGHVRRRSPLVFIVPGVLMLVPGSAGLNSAMQLLSNNTVSGITTAFDTLVTAILIAYGLMIATVILPRRISEFRPGTGEH